MPQVFPRAMNVLARASLLGGSSCWLVVWACLYTRPRTAPAWEKWSCNRCRSATSTTPAFLGIDCRYCHTSVEPSSFAGIPPTKTCMNCHSQIWVGSQMLEPVRESYRTDESLRWQRVYNLPGLRLSSTTASTCKRASAARSCHGRIDQMPFTYQVPTLLMEWCLDCHRNPAATHSPARQKCST